MKKLLCFVLLVFVLGVTTSYAGPGGYSKVFTNVTTADVNKAAMAINFTHTIMKKKGVEATLFFNVYGVALIDKTKPSPIYPTGKSVAEMLKAFMDDGGVVIGCPMCMENVGGMTKDDLMAGVTASPGMGLEAATTANTLVLSY